MAIVGSSVPSKSSWFCFDRRRKQIIVIIVLLYTVITFHLSNTKYGKKFYSPQVTDVLLPTSSHCENLNLKSFSSEGKPLMDLREQLTYTFPYDSQKPIPRRIWQTWKVGSDSKDFPSGFRSLQKEWTSAASESFEYSLVPDDHIIPFLENLYGEVPLVVKAFKAMPVNILKADFLRYLLLYARGGIYSDMDTLPLKPLDSWPSLDSAYLQELKMSKSPIPYKSYDPKKIPDSNSEGPGLVIGIEADPDRLDWNDWYARRIQFCQWTIQSKPGHPILRELILNITATTLNSVSNTKNSIQSLLDKNHINDYNVNYRDKKGRNDTYPHETLKTKSNVDGTDIMNWTGPGIFSDIILEYMNNLIEKNSDVVLLNGNLDTPTSPEPKQNNDLDKSTRKFYKKISKSLQSNNVIPWEFFSLITEPVVVDDIMVLPITCFSPDVNQMGAKSSTDELAFVKHMFKGSWKDDADNNAGHK